jgi:hypothetical protein
MLRLLTKSFVIVNENLRQRSEALEMPPESPISPLRDRLAPGKKTQAVNWHAKAISLTNRRPLASNRRGS